MSSVPERGGSGGESAHIFTDEELIERIRPADIVIGVDTRNGDEAVYFGLEKMKGQAGGRVVKIPVDYSTDEPDLLAAACVTAKGSCDYGKPGAAGQSQVQPSGD